MSNFKASAKINTLVGNDTNMGWDAIEHQVRMIQAEWDETCNDGVKARDLHEFRDGIGDMLFTVYGLAHRAGVDADKDYLKVVESQFTKFDPTEADALKTVDKYKAIGILVYQEWREDTSNTDTGGYWVTYSAVDQIDAQGRDCPKGKWLKSYRYQEPVFDPLPEDVQLKLAV